MTGTSADLLQAIRGPIMLITLGGLIAIDHFGVFRFATTWPVLVIVFGVLKLGERMVRQPVYQPAGPPPVPGYGYPPGPPPPPGGIRP